MKKIIFFFVLLPMISFGQSYSNFSQYFNFSDFIYSGGGGGSATISITNNVLTASFNGGWSTGQMRTGVIKYLNITPVISYLEFGPIMDNSNSNQTGYFAKIENNNLIVYTYTYPNTTGFYLNFTKSFTLSKITFDYDTAGNQTKRDLCINCTKTNYKTTKPKEAVALQEKDLQKFFPEDVISYYPNPVKEELYLKWELINDNKVTSIQVYTLSGQVIQSYPNLEKKNTKTIPFQYYPTGTYLIVLLYSNGEQKDLKIIKK